jgi:hypothetical protein
MHHHQTDFKMGSPDGIQRIDQLWLVTYVNKAGQEIVAQAEAVTGEYVPLIAADPARLESIVAAGRGLAKANNLKCVSSGSPTAQTSKTSRHERAGGCCEFVRSMSLLSRANSRV